ncbi:hypothetical protein [Aquimarina sp. I32.4]|uniref:hypothetical protein n=1 Tax=Aquimarina sp. I32.4 TaxID=2053903 RepID=UPI001304C630|nr:hypothetical protein [Aquimarina sp. I32.4]
MYCNGAGILYSNGYNQEFATNRFTELIMYRMDINLTEIHEIEESQINFLNL